MAFKGKDSSNLDWYKLDNAAKIFPAISSVKDRFVFRISFSLYEDINPLALSNAAKITIEKFPSFKVRLKNGLFWHYFDYNPAVPKVDIEYQYPCCSVVPKSNDGYLFKISYYRNRINLEAFHALSDGTGALEFLKLLAYNYLLVTKSGEIAKGIDLENFKSTKRENSEDSFEKYYDHSKKGNRPKATSYIIKGSPLADNSLRVIEASFPTNQLLRLVKTKGATVAEYLSALMIYAIYVECLNKAEHKKMVMVSVPVNLRSYFKSNTLRNFFSTVTVGITPTKEEYSFDDVLNIVKIQLSDQLNKETLISNFSYNVASEKNWFLRFVPLFIKNFTLKRVHNKSGKSYTATLTNLGKIKLPDEINKYIKSMNVCLSASHTHPLKASVISYNGLTTLSFCSSIEETSLERHILSHLADENIVITISYSSN